MKRLFGSRQKQPQVSPKEVSESLSVRIEAIGKRIDECELEIDKYKQILAKTKARGADSFKQKVISVLKRKRLYEQQRDVLLAQQFNLDQAQFAADQVHANIATAGAIKQMNRAIKAQGSVLNAAKVESTVEEMEEQLYEQNEISGILGRFSAADDVSDDEIESQFAAILEDKEFEESVAETSTNQQYILDALNNLPPVQGVKNLDDDFKLNAW